MKLGYACLNITLGLKMRTCRLKTVEIEGMEKVKELTLNNLNEVKKVLLWNREQRIEFFRISSDIVPFGSHEIMTWDWWRDEEVLAVTKQIKALQKESNMRLSVHPGQYTIINSPNDKVVENAFRDIEYHNKLANLFGATDMVIHVGGVYGDKDCAKKRFVQNYKRLSDDIKTKLILENDDKSFHVKDVLEIHNEVGVPICFDIHHHKCNTYDKMATEKLLELVISTWKGIRIPKMHISSGKKHKTDPSHHDYVLEEDFYDFTNILGDQHVDIMFEAKKKELAVLKIRNKLAEKH
ncbi:UV damage repair endonuclease UvsE [Anaerobacillus alkalilacustris]|uniref:UV damage repair endonuclease UvsE n=1 Tax=Anaerobacillus alkalilacustris TaxID=393763 RepID=A0A1S2LLN7_9BACI|nr:UV DNA damage repair endonuclease UvsE [Anaerobacillus alkalilacustris]OIJ13438.1 UV damage repair endonuclease UvsE [Anaerobacillus alkalilacustris]